MGGVQGGDTRLSLSSACATVRCRGMYICNRKKIVQREFGEHEVN